jgi:hypothetical protein
MVRRWLLWAWMAVACGAAWGQATEWGPTHDQQMRAALTVSKFLALRDERRYEDAYDMLVPKLKELVPFDAFRELEDQFADRSGGAPSRGSMRLTWYQALPGAEPGVYVQVNVVCRYRNIPVCEDVLLLHEQPNGSFLVVRQARNFGEHDPGERTRRRPI